MQVSLLIELSRQLFRPPTDLFFTSSSVRNSFPAMWARLVQNVPTERIQKSLSGVGGRCRATNTLPSSTFYSVCFKLLSWGFLKFHSILLHSSPPPEAKSKSKWSLFGRKKRMPWFFSPEIEVLNVLAHGEHTSSLGSFERSWKCFRQIFFRSTRRNLTFGGIF